MPRGDHLITGSRAARFASSVSRHPLPTQAVGEVCGSVLESMDSPVDICLLSITPPHSGAMEDMMASIQAILEPGILVGICPAASPRPSEPIALATSVKLWCANLPELYSFALDGRAPLLTPDFSVGPSTPPVDFVPSAVLLLGDRETFHPEEFFRYVERCYGRVPIIGGFTPGPSSKIRPTIRVGRYPVASGAAGVFFGPPVSFECTTSQGCRAIGNPYTVTECSNNEILTLGGIPPLDHLNRALEKTPESPTHSIVVGIALHDSRDHYADGDFLIRPIVSVDHQTGSISIGEVVPIGTTMQFHVQDTKSVELDLRRSLQTSRARSALLFSSMGRKFTPFVSGDQEARITEEQLGPIPIGSFTTVGEFGPMGSSNYLHSFATTMMLFE